MREKNPHHQKNFQHKVYSLVFKRMVVAEVESGRLTKTEAREKYNIGGKSRVLEWCRKYGKNSKNDNYMRDDKERKSEESEQDKQRIRDLEAALADAHLRLRAQEIMMDIAKKELGVDIRKKSGTKLPKK